MTGRPPDRLDSATRLESRLLVLLAVIAGWIDALSFTALGKVFTSFQSGNLIFLGLGIDEGDAELFVGAGVSLLAFLAGTALGAYVVGRAEVDVSAIRSLVPAFALQFVGSAAAGRSRRRRHRPYTWACSSGSAERTR